MGIPELGLINVTYPEWKIKKMRQSYYASVSYMISADSLTSLKCMGLSENTIIVFFGDQSFQLEEQAEWDK